MSYVCPDCNIKFNDKIRLNLHHGRKCMLPSDIEEERIKQDKTYLNPENRQNNKKRIKNAPRNIAFNVQNKQDNGIFTEHKDIKTIEHISNKVVQYNISIDKANCTQESINIMLRKAFEDINTNSIV